MASGRSRSNGERPRAPTDAVRSAVTPGKKNPLSAEFPRLSCREMKARGTCDLQIRKTALVVILGLRTRCRFKGLIEAFW